MSAECKWCVLVERACGWVQVTVTALASLQRELIQLMPEENQESTASLIEALEDAEVMIATAMPDGVTCPHCGVERNLPRFAA